ncbi:LytTR family DNA-binding domain-containing protein [Polaribacter sp. MSW13]|uniref:LytTR family DNA-binding domain-containing protein n=1 Tax=Polaribacter marinus TaxID=2916838 RepID=A0A9X2AI66_9FLAO|nr:LytTR family DNA-binding domain-containing protein [Polaribacter marinus]MCI2228266.1 LytTR family DNA-binding domain-containing protein [Polaribacter marinus]
MRENFKVLIVEDDEINIGLIRYFLSIYCKTVTVIGEAKNINEFIDQLLHLQPDILLLDIELGEEKNTLEVLQEMDDLDCEIIITSSFKDYALSAINDYHVSSYIVKPIDVISLKRAIDRAVKTLLYKNDYIKRSEDDNFVNDIIALPNANSIDLFDVKDVLYLEADGKYTVFYMVKGPNKIVSRNIGHYEMILPKHLFFRIHHKYIVNLKKITSILRTDGNYCLLKNGKSLSIANRRIEKLRKFLNLK